MQGRNINEYKSCYRWNFDTKIIDENINADGEEISNVKWFTYEEILNMKDKLRANGYFLSTIENKMSNKIQSIEIIKSIRK